MSSPLIFKAKYCQASAELKSAHSGHQMDDEIHQQQVTRSLQEIDANFNEAHAVATGLLSKVKTFSQNMKAVHESVQVGTHFLS